MRHLTADLTKEVSNREILIIRAAIEHNLPAGKTQRPDVTFAEVHVSPHDLRPVTQLRRIVAAMLSDEVDMIAAYLQLGSVVLLFITILIFMMN